MRTPATTTPGTTSKPSRNGGSRCGTSWRRFDRDAQMISVPRSTCSTCSRTPPATCIWATPRRTRWVTSSLGTGCNEASTSCTPSAGTPSDYPPRTRLSGAVRIRCGGPTTTSRNRRPPCAATRAVSIGTGSSTPATLSTTTGTSGSFCRCSGEVSPTAKPATSTGASSARRCSPMSRWLRVNANGATRTSPRRS